MYLDYEVKIPDSRHGITRKTIRGITYIYYAYDRKYRSDKHYTVPKNTTIGKCLNAPAETMYPNTNFLKYFPEAELPETRKIADRSACLSIDDRIEQQQLVVSKAKDRYEAELEKLNQLMKKRDELRNKELLQAIEQSRRSFEEIMDFLGTDDSQD